MPKCYQRTVEFPRVNRRVVEAGFEGGEITSDDGVLLLRQADRLLGLSEAVAAALTDSRRQASCDHAALDLLRQRAPQSTAALSPTVTITANSPRKQSLMQYPG